MKTLLFIVFYASLIMASTDCFEAYSDAAKKIENKQIKIRHSYLAKSVNYSYKFYPVSMFPFFCTKEDSLGKYLEKNSTSIYLCNSTISIRQYRDKSGILHSMFSILGHTDKIKIYTLYFFKYDYTLKKWDEERKPLSVSCYLKNKIHKTWECQ